MTLGGGDLSEKTNWEAYYANRKNKPAHIAQITRKISAMIILGLLKKHGQNFKQIYEFGGGDSCFYESFRKKYSNAHYVALDSAKNGVLRFNQKFGSEKSRAILCDSLIEDFSANADCCFSVGLIEHFTPQNTRKICKKHFDVTKSGGIVLITYPTPTPLYRAIRGILEKLNMWEFKDERALNFDEVNEVCADFGNLVARRLNFYIGLTQEILVYKKY